MVISEKIISKHMILPSLQTPYSFRNHKLSFLDQKALPIYIPLIFFYQNNDHKQQVELCQLLKQSLSQILIVFNPLAGTIKENSFVDCSDIGVEFVEAHAHACLAQVIEEPNMEELNQLVPVDSLSHSDNAILSVKISLFDCGGITVGVCLSHKIADFASLVTFMHAWAATCHGETQVIRPYFDLAIHFPPKDTIASLLTPYKEKIMMKRFVFDREKLERLKQEVANFSDVKNPTSVEALSAFIWKHFIEASKAKSDKKKTSFAAIHAVNLRPRMIPQLPDQTFGNCSSFAFALMSETTDSDDLVSKLRVAIRALDNNYIKNVINDEEYHDILNKEDHSHNSGMEICYFDSLRNFPVYDVDFGWGKPVWVCTANTLVSNSTILMSTPSGDGIEAWVSMPDDVLQMLNYNNNKL